jgi:hypothetical protein
MGKHFHPQDFERLFESLRNLVDEAEAAQRSGNLSLARHATANLAFATQLIHFGLKERRLSTSVQ